MDIIDQTGDEGRPLAKHTKSLPSALCDFTDQLSTIGERLEAVTLGIAGLVSHVAMAMTIRPDERAESLRISANDATTWMWFGSPSIAGKLKVIYMYMCKNASAIKHNILGVVS